MKPHPTKSKPRIAKPSPRQPVKGRVMYENVFGEITNDPTHGGGWDKPVLVLDLSDAARERRVEAAAKALHDFEFPHNPWETIPKSYVGFWQTFFELSKALV